MAPYRFKLEPVRRLRQARRDELRGGLADAFRAAERLADERRRLEAEIADTRLRQQAAARATPLEVSVLLHAQRYELVLKAQLADLDRKAVAVAQEIDRRRSAVAAAERDVKALDLMDERRRERHRREEQRAEAKQMDEAAGIAWSRAASGREGARDR